MPISEICLYTDFNMAAEAGKRCDLGVTNQKQCEGVKKKKKQCERKEINYFCWERKNLISIIYILDRVYVGAPTQVESPTSRSKSTTLADQNPSGLHLRSGVLLQS